MLSRWPPLRMSSGGSVATWAYDSIIYSGVSRWSRDVYCIVGVNTDPLDVPWKQPRLPCDDACSFSGTETLPSHTSSVRGCYGREV